jgi:hypothetical protein
MKNILLSALGSSILLFTACEKKSEKTEMSISTTINSEGGQAIKKEVITINENVNGKSVVLSMENSTISSLAIDGQTIAKEDYQKYNDLLGPLLKKLPALPTPPSIDNTQSTGEGENIDKILESELKRDGFITEGNVKYDFDLSKETLTINNKTQPNDMKERYLKLFKDKTGKDLGEKFHIKLQESRINK